VTRLSGDLVKIAYMDRAAWKDSEQLVGDLLFDNKK
jgi:hypothetical protein